MNQKLTPSLLWSLLLHLGIVGLLSYNFGFHKPIAKRFSSVPVNTVVATDNPPKKQIKAGLIKTEVIEAAIKRQELQETKRQQSIKAEERKIKSLQREVKKVKKNLNKTNKERTAALKEKEKLNSEKKKALKEKQLLEKSKSSMKKELAKLEVEQAKLLKEKQSYQRQIKADKAVIAKKHKLDREFIQHVAEIKQRIIDNRTLSSVFTDDLVCEIRIRLLPDGVLNVVEIIQSSGNPAYDILSEQAVYKASPFLMPADQELVERLQDIVLVFTTEDNSFS